jgi:hypothetical protein
MTSSPSSAEHDLAPVDERLVAIKAEGRRRRARRYRVRAGLAGVAAFAVVAGVAVLPADDGTPVHTEAADEGTSTTRRTEVLGTVIEREPTDTTVTTVAPDATTTTAARTVATTPPAPPTAPAGPCQTGPECGAFRWEPAPAPNRPLVLTHDPVGSATAGQPVTITVRWSDADAQLSFIDDDTDGALLAEACVVEPRWGPWTPPAPAPGSGAVAVTFTPAEAGPHTVEVYAASGPCDGYHPYHSVETLTITVQVAPAPPAQE